jgi:putative hydrolase of the HAD superfamily
VPLRAVLFDLFDTLVDLRVEDLPRIEVGGRSLPATVGRLHELAAACAPDGRPLALEEFARALLETDREFEASHLREHRELPTRERFAAVARRLGLGDPELPGRLASQHMALFRERARVPAHHPELLARLAGGLRLGLCSNFSCAQTALGILDEAGLAPHLESVAISEAVGLRKPRCEIFEAALAGLGVAPGEALHVGDSLRADVAGAAALGIRTVWITRRVGDPERALREYGGPPPDWRIGDLAELPRVLEEAAAPRA